MRVVLYDGIQETHVAASLQRALLSAGHEVYSTGRFGSGYLFRDPGELRPVVGPHLDRIADFRPDLVLVFRPASAPYPVLQALRGTGAVLAAWLSDDPVLFEHSYGPVVELYDLVLHCGNEEVLRFYERRFGRPTGVNFPFWTDHVAFPAVYGQLEPETTVLFLGNVTGPVRRARYDQLAAMGHPVTIYGRVGPDPAGLGGGFLDSEAEVADAARRAQVALNIPQFFRDHRGQPTWFPGLDELGYFDLPSRVIQYAAMGLPTVSVVPGAPHSPAYPELEVRGSIQEADRWVGEVLASGRLPELSSRTLDRFDRSFSAGARVLALESLMRDDAWRSLDAADRTVWFLQFDGRPDAGPVAAPRPAPVVLAETTAEPSAAGTGLRREAQRDPGTGDSGMAGTEDVVLVHRQPLRRFGPTDVVRRELEAWGRLAAGRGPEEGDTRPAPAGSAFTAVLEARTLLAALRGRPVRLLVVADGIGLTADDASVLRAAGIATVCLVTEERLTREDVAEIDLVVRVGAAPVDRVALLQGVDHVLQTPGVVESTFLQAVRQLDGPQDGRQDERQDGPHGLTVVRAADDPATDAVLEGLPGPHRELTGDELTGSRTDDLAAALARPVVYLQPMGSGRRQSHPPVTPYAVCASPTVLTTRHRAIPDQDPWGPWLTKVATAGEASMKLARRASVAAPEALPEMERRRHLLDARRQLSDWFDRAATRLAASTTAPDDAGITAGSRPDTALTDGADRLMHLDRRYPLGAAEMTCADGEYLSLTLRFAGPDLVQGLRVLEGERTVAEVRFAAGTAGAVEVVATGAPDLSRGPLCVEVLGDRNHRLHGVSRVRVRLQTHRGLRRHEAVPSRTLAVHLLPVPAADVDAVQPRTPGHPRDPGHPREQDQ